MTCLSSQIQALWNSRSGIWHLFVYSQQWLLQVVLDGNSEQEFLVNATVPQCSNFDPTLFLLYFYDLRDDVICDIAICADDTTQYSKCDQASGL